MESGCVRMTWAPLLSDSSHKPRRRSKTSRPCGWRGHRFSPVHRTRRSLLRFSHPSRFSLSSAFLIVLSAHTVGPQPTRITGQYTNLWSASTQSAPNSYDSLPLSLYSVSAYRVDVPPDAQVVGHGLQLRQDGRAAAVRLRNPV